MIINKATDPNFMATTLSIVTPVYNGERYLAQTIESVLSQEGDFYIDYIIIDDGSTDNSLEIIKKYNALIQNKKWPTKCLGMNFSYRTGPNRGQTSAYNTGFKMAKGDLLAWMNADDYYLPKTFSAIAKYYEDDPSVDFFYGDCLKIYEGATHREALSKPNPNESLENLKTRGNSFDLCFFTKRIFEQVGPLDENLHYCIDLDFWFKVFAVGKIKYVPWTIAAFRIWKGSKTGSQQDKFTAERKLIFKKYGGNLIPPKKIYGLRKKIPAIDLIQQKTPRIYKILKNMFYRIIDQFKYKSLQ
jgi:glycosyltransferase involved in cell wall biosynthesis